MVNALATASLTLGALLSLTQATPIDTGAIMVEDSASLRNVTSYKQWIDQIIANPDGDHASPDEAFVMVREFNEHQERSMVEPRAAGDLIKDAICMDPKDEGDATCTASIPDFLYCIEQVSRSSERHESSWTPKSLCTRNDAVLSIWKDDENAKSSWYPSSKIASAAGALLDVCTTLYTSNNNDEVGGCADMKNNKYYKVRLLPAGIDG